MRIVVHTVGELREALRDVPAGTPVRTEAELPDWLKGKGIHAICGDLQTVSVSSSCVFIGGKDPTTWKPAAAESTGPPDRRRRRSKAW